MEGKPFLLKCAACTAVVCYHTIHKSPRNSYSYELYLGTKLTGVLPIPTANLQTIRNTVYGVLVDDKCVCVRCNKLQRPKMQTRAMTKRAEVF